MGEVTVVECNEIPASYHLKRERNMLVTNTYDFKNVSPKLQLNNALFAGGSVETRLPFASHTGLPVEPCTGDKKSRASTGNWLPPNWKASVCRSEHGYRVEVAELLKAS